MSVRIFCRFRIFARSHRNFRFVRIGTCAFRCRHVDYFTCQDVSFCHCVLCCEGLACTRSQARDRPFVSGEFICHRDISDRQVSVVGHCDLVGDLFAERVCFAVLGFGGRCLIDCQMSVRVFRICSRAGRLSYISNSCSNCIRE